MSKKRILVVDDESVIRDLFRQAFSRNGYAVSVVESAEEALVVLGQNNIHVMFLDLKLPGMNGLDLCRRIRKDRPMAIIHAVTGYASLFELSDCREAGFDDYFTKPVDLEILMKAAQDAFGKIERWKKR